jgi:hypothetical protein
VPGRCAPHARLLSARGTRMHASGAIGHPIRLSARPHKLSACLVDFGVFVVGVVCPQSRSVAPSPSRASAVVSALTVADVRAVHADVLEPMRSAARTRRSRHREVLAEPAEQLQPRAKKVPMCSGACECAPRNACVGRGAVARERARVRAVCACEARWCA